MNSIRPARWVRAATPLALVLVAGLIAGCDGNVPFFNGEPTPEAIANVSYGPCLPHYGDDVRAAALSRDGTRIVYLSGDRPADLGEDAAWYRDDRAVHVLDLLPPEGKYLNLQEFPPAPRHIVASWDPTDVLGQYATAEADSSTTPLEAELTETLADLDVALSGDRFVVAVEGEGVNSMFSKLYRGAVPAEDNTTLSPVDGGLTVVPINDYAAQEGVQQFQLNDDGSRLAAIVGVRGEVRVYEFEGGDGERLLVYTRGADGSTTISNTLPPVDSLTGDATHNSAVASGSAIKMAWAPDGNRLALARTEGVGRSSLSILNVTTGAITSVRTFDNATLPQVAWASDGTSLFVMTTRLVGARLFGETEIRRLAAEEGGREIGPGGVLPRDLGYNTEPANLVPLVPDESFVFTWEDALWRLDVPGGDASQATYIPLTPENEDMTIAYSRPGTATGSDMTVFVFHDRYGSHLGVREASSQDSCPEDVIAPLEGEAEGEAPAEGEAEGEAPAEGEGDEG